MIELKDFRIINELEKSIIYKSLRKISLNFDVIQENFENRLYISFNRTFSRNIYPSIYLLSTEQLHLVQRLNRDIEISSIGLYFGFIKKKDFRLSIEGAEFLFDNSYISNDQILIVDSFGEKSVLYGNDIKKENVIKFPKKSKKGDFLIISNEKNEICAIAYLKTSSNDLFRLKSKDKVAVNLVDKGYYLRKKQ